MSKYPKKIDSSADIPIVRNNITELTSDVINSIRQGVVNIERTLGINPHGSKRDLNDRISVSLDESGKIKDAAIKDLGLLSGPVKNSDISENANISEYKLDLDFSTKYLQTEIKIISSKIDDIILSISEISSLFKIHTDKRSLNQHSAIQVDVSEAITSPSSSSAVSLNSGTVQEAFEKIYNSHINFSGATSVSNNSHSANQIFYDSSSITGFQSFNVENALDYILRSNDDGFYSSLSSITKNSIFRSGNERDDFSSEIGNIIYEGEVFYSDSFSKDVTISLSVEQKLPDLKVGDIVVLKYGSSGSENILTISKIFYSIPSEFQVSSVVASGDVTYEYSSGTTAKFISSVKIRYENGSLSLAIRPSSSSSTDSIIVTSSPSCPRVVSSGFKIPTLSEKNIDIEFEGGVHTIDVLDSTYINSIDSVTNKLNLYFASNNLPISAAKINVGECFEICISHMIPNDSAVSTRPFLKILDSASDNATDILGFSYAKDKIIYGSNSTSAIINGKVFDDIFHPADVTSYIGFSSGLSFMVFSDSNPFPSNIREKDFIYVEDSGSFIGFFNIKSISSDTIELAEPYTFSFDKGSSTKIFLLKNSYHFDEKIAKSEISSDYKNFSTSIYLTDSGHLSGSTKVESFGKSSSSSSVVKILDVSPNYIENFSGSLTFDASKNLFVTKDGVSGEKVNARFSGNYKVPLSDGSGFLYVEVVTDGAKTTTQISFSFNVYGEDDISVLPLGVVCFSSFLSYFGGGSSFLGSVNISSVQDTRSIGPISSENINNKFFSEHLNLPRSEMNSNLVISGFDIISEDAGHIVISGGLAYINGKRVYVDRETRIDFSLASDEKIVILINTEGCFDHHIFKGPLDYGFQKNKIPLFYSDYIKVNTSDSDYLPLYKTPSGYFHRLSKFFGEVQNKITEVTVGSKGNFLTIFEAVEYFRSSSNLYSYGNECFKIKLMPEVHYISESIVIGDFDLEIVGSGNGCEVRITDDLATTWIDVDSNVGVNPKTSMFITAPYSNGFGYSSYTRSKIIFNNVYFVYTVYSGLFCVNIIYTSSSNETIPHTKFENCKFVGSASGINQLPASPTSSNHMITPVIIHSTITLEPRSRASLLIQDCVFERIGRRNGTSVGSIVYISHPEPINDGVKDNLNVDHIKISDCHIIDCADTVEDFEYILHGQGVELPTVPFNLNKNFIVKDCFVYNN